VTDLVEQKLYASTELDAKHKNSFKF